MAGHQYKLKKGRVESNIPSSPLACLISVDLPGIESSNLLVVPPQLSVTWMIHESRGIPRCRRPRPAEDRLERDPKLVCHVASSSRREEMTAPMHWFIGGSLPPSSFSSLEDGPVLVFHLLSFVCHLCWYWFAGLRINVAVDNGSWISRFEANVAIPQLLAQ